jgi:hypothetical protein
MKENIHILEILKQISNVKSNVKMKKSKVFDHPWFGQTYLWVNI